MRRLTRRSPWDVNVVLAAARVMPALILIALLAAGTGCRGKAAAQKVSPDDPVLQALGQFQPKVKQNDEGRVVELKLEGKRVTDQALDEVRNLPELKTLSLYGSSVSDAGVAKLKEMPRLEALGLGKTKVTRKGLAHLERMATLKWVWVTENEQITKEDVTDFKKKAVPGLMVYH